MIPWSTCIDWMDGMALCNVFSFHVSHIFWEGNKYVDAFSNYGIANHDLLGAIHPNIVFMGGLSKRKDRALVS